MQVTRKDHILKVMSLTRFHFVAGLPEAGARYFTSILSQNPRFCVASDSPAARVFGVLTAAWEQADMPLGNVDAGTRMALLRASVDAVHHARKIESVVVDSNPDWLAHFALLTGLFPLSRFIVLVRDPARIAAELARDRGAAQSPASLMSEHGAIGKPVAQVQAALHSAAAERLLLIDFDRFSSDPTGVFDALYRFLGETPFEHDFRTLPKATAAPDFAASGFLRRVAVPDGGQLRRPQKSALPIWRRSPGSAATMLLPEAG